MNYTYVGVILIRSDGAVLIQHRDDIPTIPEPNKWGICGGKREKEDRSDKHAAARELLEETGYVVMPNQLQHFTSDSFWAGENLIERKFYWANYDGKQKIACFEGQEIRFVSLSEVSGLDFCDEYHREYLVQASEQKRGMGVEGSRQLRK